MNINAQEGDKVIITEDSIENGYEFDKHRTKNHLKIGDIYTIDYSIIHKWSTEVFIKEVPNVSFNSVNFEDHK